MHVLVKRHGLQRDPDLEKQKEAPVPISTLKQPLPQQAPKEMAGWREISHFSMFLSDG